MKHTLIAMLIAGSAIAMSSAQAQTAASTPATPAAKTAASSSASASTTSTKPAKKTAKKKVTKAPAAPVVVDEETKEPDVSGTTVVEYQCEVGNKVTVYINNGDDKHIALKWGKRVHRMTRVDTTTGADRFENHHYGLVWIDIPAKGILLDSKSGHQLANDCKDAEQRAPKAPETPAATPSAQG